MATFYMKQNDANTDMYATLKNADDTVIDLSTASKVKFHVGYEGDVASKLIDANCTIVNAATGRVRFRWTASHAALEPGTYDAEFEITWPDGTIRTVPSKSGQCKVVIAGEIA